MTTYGSTWKRCPCGSGLQATIAYDARGIELGLVCNRCESAKLSKFRPDVLTDPNYPTFEDIEPND